jgi:polar amino acid transport system substrate-binding protein
MPKDEKSRRRQAAGDRHQPGGRGVLVHPGRKMVTPGSRSISARRGRLGVPIEYVAYPNSGLITDAASKGAWDVTFLPKDSDRETKMTFGPVYEVADATYIVKPGSTITNFAMLDQPGIKVAAVNDTTTMRGAIAHLKNAG